MKKVALVTCYFKENFGSQLQAYATQKIFDELGVVNETVCVEGFKNEINRAKYLYFIRMIFDLNTVRDKLGFVKHLIAKRFKDNNFKKKMLVRNGMFNKFSSEKFHLSKKYKSLDDLRHNATDYSGFVVGSDQLWLPSNIEANYYTLNFVPNNIPKIAFSTSFGVTKMPFKQKNKASYFLNRIEYISVREKSGAEIVFNLTSRTVPTVCDPTLLFTANQWLDIQPKSRIISEKYIFCYFLGDNPEQRVFANLLRNETGIKIVQLQHMDKYIHADENFPDYAPYDIGPAEFISLIRDAEYILTDSFHGTVFSLLYSKIFFSFKRYNKESSVSTNSRIYSLLSILELEDRLLNANEDIKECLALNIDYTLIHEKIDQFREYSLSYLTDSLKKTKILV
jgi:hypothetical protein